MSAHPGLDLAALYLEMEDSLCEALAYAAGESVRRGKLLPLDAKQAVRVEAGLLIHALTLSGLMIFPRRHMDQLVAKYVAREMERVKDEGLQRTGALRVVFPAVKEKRPTKTYPSNTGEGTPGDGAQPVHSLGSEEK